MATVVHSRSNGRAADAGAEGAVATAIPAGTTIPPVAFDHEQLAIRRGERSGLHVIVAVHSTALGPALGGVRMWHYRETIDGIRDALRLAAGMTLKAAAAQLDLGGGKGVIIAPPEGLEGERRRAALLDFGDLVESLDGRYITAEDVGISPGDLVTIRERTSHVTGLPPEEGGSGDPSPFTAIGVEAALRACARARFGAEGLAGRSACVVGLGHVGARLAKRLADADCTLAISDIDPAKRALADELGAEWLEPDEAMLSEQEMLAPCALGGAITPENVDELRCEIVCGSANNQLADDALAEALAERGVLYAPDFIANAGGLIHVYKEIKGYSEQRAMALAQGIERTLGWVLAVAAQREVTPLTAARELAGERLDVALRD
jgi:leucine dehydrogenase